MQTVLVIEDSKFLKIANERLLTKAGYRVLTAADGEEGLRIIQDEHPDLVLLDMMLPKLGGVEVLQAIRRNPATAGIPVIVLTGLSRMNEEKLIRAGATAFLEKGPLLDNPQEFRDVVARVLQQHAAKTPGAEAVPGAVCQVSNDVSIGSSSVAPSRSAAAEAV